MKSNHPHLKQYQGLLAAVAGLEMGYLSAWNLSWSGMEWLSHMERRFGAQGLSCSTSEALPVVETTGIVAFLCC